jgi:hypothetical protein
MPEAKQTRTASNDPKPPLRLMKSKRSRTKWMLPLEQFLN